jgi:parvulin-like peptidyl-prolyl isomerase
VIRTVVVSPRFLPRLLVAALAVVMVACGGDGGGAGNANVAATVNGIEIPVSELETRIEQALQNPQVAQQVEGDPAVRTQLQTQVLSRMVEMILLDHAAADVGVTVSDQEIQGRLDEIKSQFGSEQEFLTAIQQQGVSPDDLNTQVRALVLGEKIQDAVGRNVEQSAVTDEEVQASYEQQFDGGEPVARHILVETEQEAEQVKARIDDGEDFADLARELSTDQSNAAAGGLLGEVMPDTLVPEFEQAVTEAEDGEVVGPVQTQYGFHVIQRLASPPPHSIVDEGIREQLLEQERANAFQSFVAEQRQKAAVAINPRFGQWNPETGQIETADPLGEELQSPAQGAPNQEPPG